MTLERLTTMNDEEDDNMTGTPLYEDHNEFLHGQKSRSNKDKIISSKFIRKYLYVAKMQKPILTKVCSPLSLFSPFSLLSRFGVPAFRHFATLQPVN